MRNDAAAVTERKLDLDSFLPYRLSVLSNHLSAIARQYSARFDLNVSEWRTMAVLGGTPGLSAREVAHRTAMDKVQVSRAVASLMKKKRVQRETDGNDARITRLSLTPKGRAIYDQVVPLALHLEELFVSALSPAERATLDQLMTKLARQSSLLGGAS